MRIGHGYDVHQLVAGRALILGGVKIPYEQGLLGHSDADVLLHAVSAHIANIGHRIRIAIFRLLLFILFIIRCHKYILLCRLIVVIIYTNMIYN